MIDKNEVLILAAEMGYFRTKRAEKKNTIHEELVSELQKNAIEDKNPAVFNDAEFSAAVLDILNAEVKARSDAYRKREATRIAKAEAEASKPVSGGANSSDEHIRQIDDKPTSGVYVITTAQNNTDVDQVFWGALQTYVRERGAKLLVCKTTYNKNAFLQPEVSADAPDLWYAPEVKPYLMAGHIELTPNIHIIADANVIPTAKNPLSGFEGATAAGVSMVIPAMKIALKCTAALTGAEGKVLFSTGAITKRNYILRKAGAVAQAEHNIGALIVETFDDGTFNARQLELMPGCAGFYDEGLYFGPDKLPGGHRSAALQFGDIHAEKMLPENMEKCCNLIAFYKPENLLIHDVLDFSSRNHHNVKDPTFIFTQHVKGNTVENDLRQVAHVLDEFYEAGEAHDMQLHIIESNHDLAINTWLKNADFKQDPVNAITYLRCMLEWYRHIQEHEGEKSFNMLKFACQHIGWSEYARFFDFHETDESVIIAGVEMGCHGHNGVNGSRGSPAQFRTLGVPMNTGHTHTPSICGAVYTAGVSAALDMGYNVGASSWRYAHILTWPNGQRQIIFA